MTGVPLAWAVAPDAPSRHSTQQRAPDGRSAGDGLFDGGRLLSSDVRVAYLLLNEARRRVISRVFRVSDDDSALVTAIALGITGATLGRKVTSALRSPGRPDRSDVVIGAALLRGTIDRLAGASDSPIRDAVVIAVLASAVLRPVLRRASHRAMTSVYDAHTVFEHRYGHLIRRHSPRR